MSLRLPTWGGDPSSSLTAAPSWWPSSPIEPSVWTVGIAATTGLGPAGALGSTLVRAFADDGHPVCALVATRSAAPSELLEGASAGEASWAAKLLAAGAHEVRWLRLGPDASSEVLDRAFDSFRGAGLVVALGNEIAMAYRPALSVLLTGGLAQSRWPGGLVAMASSADVLVAEPREAFGRELARAISRVRGAV